MTRLPLSSRRARSFACRKKKTQTHHRAELRMLTVHPVARIQLAIIDSYAFKRGADISGAFVSGAAGCEDFGHSSGICRKSLRFLSIVSCSKKESFHNITKTKTAIGGREMYSVSKIPGYVRNQKPAQAAPIHIPTKLPRSTKEFVLSFSGTAFHPLVITSKKK